MTREARANLIFLILFLVISIPGLIMLIRKQLDPTRRPMGQPDTVKRHVVYIDPTDAPGEIPRMVPQVTSSWATDLARGRIGLTSLPVRTDANGVPTPIMSAGRLAQLVGIAAKGPDSVHVAILVWNVPRDVKQVELTATASIAGSPIALSEVSSERIPTPIAVKRDLQGSGYPRPPLEVVLYSAVAAPVKSGDGIEVRLRMSADGRLIEDTLQIPAVSSPAPGGSR